MEEIMTVLGPIPPERLGLTSMHEHILYDGTVYRKRLEAFLPNEELPVKENEPVNLENIGYLRHNFILTWDAVSMHDEGVMVAELADFKTSGGSAIVDMSTPGLRSNISGIRRISEKTGVHVIATTGLYAEDSWPEKFCNMSTEEYTAFMMGEIKHGIADTGIKPGHIKIAIEEGPTPQGELLLRAAARVSQETGFSVTIHQGTFMTDQEVRRIIDVIVEEGIEPERTIICHVQDFFVPWDLKTLVLDPDSWRLQLDFPKELLDRGFNISVDCFGHIWDMEPLGYINQTDWQRLAGLAALINAGYSEKIVLGTDTYLKILTRRFGGEGYCRLTKSIIPILRQVGVSEDDIQKLIVENPARLLAY
jgi:phosphotriesterase-related protein